jgi:eukaryotic-like serine/threonine-protein kinase
MHEVDSVVRPERYLGGLRLTIWRAKVMFGSIDRMVAENTRKLAARPSDSPAERVATALVNRPYRPIRFLAQGAVGEVWVVRHARMGKPFALKVLHQHLVKDRFCVERFALEARVTASLEHPNVVSVSDYWVAEDGRHCLVMQLLSGQTLAHELKDRARLPAPEVIRYGCQTLRALTAAHAKGVVHRDIKPENLFLHQVPNVGIQVKLLDFGMARVASADSESARFRPLHETEIGTCVGSPRYVSPEALRGKAADFRSDIYSLGVVMYVAMLGEYSQFDFATVPTFVPPSELGAEGSDAILDAIVLRAVRMNPEERFQSSQEFLDELLPHHPPVQYSHYCLPPEAQAET